MNSPLRDSLWVRLEVIEGDGPVYLDVEFWEVEIQAIGLVSMCQVHSDNEQSEVSVRDAAGQRR